MNGSTNIQTAVRIRPYISWEKTANIKPLWQVKANSIVQILDETLIGESYTFDHIFEENKTNQDVYRDIVKPLVISCLQGINSTIFAYGQTSSGKTHTMLGDKGTPGIIGLAVDDVFGHMEEKSTDNFILRCSYLEIYNEKINDLLHSNVTDLKIREDVNQGVHVIVKEEIIRTPEELFTLMKRGMKSRKVGSTDMNERSSRSHSIFKLVIQSQSEGLKGSYTESTLSLVDLAGSERVGQMKMGKDRQLEGVSINKSLTALGLVIRKLSEGESFINYRDSKLTRILQHSLGGNSKTLIIATITVAVSEETKSTLDFAHRAKFVKNRPVVNRRVTDKDQLKEYESLCQNYKVQIEKLTGEKLDHEKKINALEGKIQCIEKFSDFGQKSTIRHQVPSRRHTFAHFKPESTRNPLPFSLLSIDEECLMGDIDTPSKSVIQSDEIETDVIDDGENIMTPNRKPPFEDLDSPKTALTRLKVEKELMEQSYQNLVLFTNLENQIKLECDELKEMRDLCDRLRNDNLELREDRPILLAKVEYFHNQLITLQTILGGSVERNSEHLYTIPEEKIDFFLEDTELTEKISDDEEKVRFKHELSKKDDIIDALEAELNNQKVRFESVLTEMNKLKEHITDKNLNIEKLNSIITQDRNIKEAELDILNCKIQELTCYKEEMHNKLSELSQKDDIIDALEEDLNNQKVRFESVLTEMNKLKEDITDKNLNIEKLNSIITQDRNIKEAELDILNYCESCASLRNKAVELRSQTTALTDEVDNLKSENKFLDKENADMLQMIRNYQERELELDNKLMKYEQCEKVDKETQATCDLQQKYNALKRILRLRKREAMSTES
ncbi:hypothetical protein HUJ04_003998 [Dendroctonus ponderosae]|nr:hypothetical protein HUJ04_003998 [Dendroctonus ponderosae]